MAETGLQVLLVAVAAYLAGSIPFGLLLGRLKQCDIRRHGSGNIGATNVTRVLGRPWGIACFVLDFAKGLAPVLAVLLLVGRGPAPAVAAAAAVAGHVWPVFLKFRGGKGVATSIGALLALAPWSVLCAAALWALLFVLTRYVSVASLGAALALPASGLVLHVAAGPVDLATRILLGAVAVLIVVRHRANIARLLCGREHRFSRPERSAQ